jgi:hypothetical protein
VIDGAADPTMVYNHEENTWWIMYTQCRANQDTPDVGWVFGTKIGLASTPDRGKTFIDENGAIPYSHRRSSLQVAELELSDGIYIVKTGINHLILTCIKG